MGTGLRQHEFCVPSPWNGHGTLGTRQGMLPQHRSCSQALRGIASTLPALLAGLKLKPNDDRWQT